MVTAPKPIGPVPSLRQLAWHAMEFYGFIHFTVNTFTDKEWGYGDESPAIFAPTSLDAKQWAQVAKMAGMKGLILTAKHHDGFCLWPSRYTDHCVRNSPWKDGKGDVVRELANACEDVGIKFGIYLSPWDRHQCTYGRREYLAYYRWQLMELLTQYGELFEVWFDGANGGDGFYGGARETRTIDKRSYYDWENTWQLVRDLQPNAVMFSDVGPDVRWVGNEKGVATETSWCMLDAKGAGWVPGDVNADLLPVGHERGGEWVPAETDVSIRPGWFYHASEDDKVRTPANLEEIYYSSVGRNTSLLLNLPPDRRGLIHERDVEALSGFRSILDRTFAKDLAQGATIASLQTRGGDEAYSPRNLLKADKSYFATDDEVKSATIELAFPRSVRFDRILLQEQIELGQRVKAFRIEAAIGGNWREIARGTTIGAKRIICVPATDAERLRLVVEDARACVTLQRLGVFASPAV